MSRFVWVMSVIAISTGTSASAASGTQIVMGEVKVAQHAMNSVTLLNGCGLEKDKAVATVTKQVEAFLRSHTNLQGRVAYDDYKASSMLEIGTKMGQAGESMSCSRRKQGEGRFSDTGRPQDAGYDPCLFAPVGKVSDATASCFRS